MFSFLHMGKCNFSLLVFLLASDGNWYTTLKNDHMELFPSLPLRPVLVMYYICWAPVPLFTKRWFSSILQHWNCTGSGNTSSWKAGAYLVISLAFIVLKTWRYQKPRHQQPWYWLMSAGIFHFQHQNVFNFQYVCKCVFVYRSLPEWMMSTHMHL